MSYETISCADTTCPFIRKGVCKFDKFSELPCEELDEEEFKMLKVEMEGVE